MPMIRIQKAEKPFANRRRSYGGIHKRSIFLNFALFFVSFCWLTLVWCQVSFLRNNLAF
jgi:hypothetical protein